MKHIQETKEGENGVAGDVIGNTAYSERFVLKILLKLADLDTLKDEIKGKSFEDDLCTLWDMTAEKDVVLYLHKHNILNLLQFVLPIVETPRIFEIIIGITGNLCCEKEVVSTFLKMDLFLENLIRYISSDDSFILIQLLRVINSALFITEKEDLSVWMTLFEHANYSEALYFILKNSCNKNVLTTAIENMNTISTYCNINEIRVRYFTHFVNEDALTSLATALNEIMTNHKQSCTKIELERALVVSLQVTLNLVSFKMSPPLSNDVVSSITGMLTHIIKYYEDQIVNSGQIDVELPDIFESVESVIITLETSKISDPIDYLESCITIWKSISKAIDREETDNAADSESNALHNLLFRLRSPLQNIICDYLISCPNNFVSNAWSLVSNNYDSLVGCIENEDTKLQVLERYAKHSERK